MKYINHMTSSSDDEKHEALIERCGMAGYGAYWVVVEKIAAQIRPECVSTSLTISWRNWARHLRTSTKQAQFWLRRMNDASLIVLTETADTAKVDIPNILKYGDEYTKRLGINSRQTPDKLPTISGLPAVPEQQKHMCVSSDQEEKPRARNEYPEEFEAFWSAYPKRVNKLVAFGNYKSVRKHPEHTAERVHGSAVEYAEECLRKGTAEQYIMHPATFLSKDRWKEYCLKEATHA